MSWGVGKITLALYPFGMGAMSVNAFFASLIGSWIGLPVVSVTESIVIGAVIAVPLTWLFARHIKGLIEEADQPDD